MKKILILGGNGMVGKNFIENNNSNKICISPSSSELNLLDYNACLSFFNECQPDVILHCAGLVGGIQANMNNPVDFLLKNTDIGRNVVWAAYNANIKTLINIGSSCMYPRDAENPLKEDLILKGELEPTNEGYALAKIFTQRLCSYINKQYPSFHFKTIIPCNLFGKYDKFEESKSHLIPAIIHKIHHAKENNENEVEIWGDGLARREFMYAKDLALILWKVVENFENIPDVMNVGLGYDYSILEYYQTVSKVLNYNGNFKFNLNKPVGMKQKVVEISNLKRLNLSINHDLSNGIKETYDYYLTLINKK
ncbi:MAG: NAD-dependent epimerase/dehydratase family protein [Flavobacteriia bacterium]|nr:NAD-dependent epimerase/dehydratase family protein [Flavobacteriia bacterium]